MSRKMNLGHLCSANSCKLSKGRPRRAEGAIKVKINSDKLLFSLSFFDALSLPKGIIEIIDNAKTPKDAENVTTNLSNG
jgi:hypothetical protein